MVDVLYHYLLCTMMQLLKFRVRRNNIKYAIVMHKWSVQVNPLQNRPRFECHCISAYYIIN